MFRTTIIAISGSVGKSTAKEAIATVLAAHFPTQWSYGNRNHFSGVFRSLFGIRPWHRYAVIEIGLDGPGQMKWLAWAVRPDIAVWVNVARTHTRNFKTLEITAKEKSLLVHSLRRGGLAILNSDNPYIAAFTPPAGIRTIRYGERMDFDWCFSQAASAWPERLSFRVQSNGEHAFIQTRLVGKHWVPSVLPALIIAREAGLSLEQTAGLLTTIEPIHRRLSPETTTHGAIILRDERNGSVDTLAVALEVMREAKAKRRIVIFAGVADSEIKDGVRYRRIGFQIAQIAEAAIFIGDCSAPAVKGALGGGMAADQVWGFYNLEDAAKHLRSELREGDLVLLRGRKVDHLARLCLALTMDVTCWRITCAKLIFCEDCPQLSQPSKSKNSLVQIST